MDERTRLRLDVSYDGTDFSGWAPQPARRTVAGVLMQTLDLVLGAGTATGLTVAGRTDAGVHATGQVCHLDLPTPVWREHEGRLLRRLARLLPPDVRVRAMTEVPADFDARFSATFRRYEYRVTDAPWGAEPLRRGDTLAWPKPLDLAALNAAAAGLVGEHDFAAYCRRKENATTLREVTRLDWRRDPDGILVATVQADAFCQNMVRSLVGAMLVAGDGRRPVQWPAGLLTRRERSSEVTVAPAHGLALVAVGYPGDPAEYARRAEETRRLRVPVAEG
ncbi:tRNA pseudouridine(38-40) synthase TruA [Micromonospora aurantiaca]|uniref:tRNA pseudouridine(38-40) synthase TruA n=1 Tax=Micromonospora TaxID=1873 RepID=UPI0001BF0921|nr:MULTISPECIES: tRNA pseudouridine(38-40) synthase TruA [Micromonospora]ADL49001.1 tRNA-pseudouridine synthase I [Micromonospora aurantiaca ATCC 27029]ADU06137.1 tRNA-pseudouridine synthase I [Micromonospora sp. L5]MDG4754288.1 tRNA pseudouridine(38-40) synthase TruA [Micromonospora sp. WMMD718]OHX05636.1 tRNA pseudouridine(38-40) synthase TruA [Micromonospora sp. WMMB235]RNI03745.1 tRNA pseudouridine(38-40) synthase TruA [Micromonospora aurantiaca]